MSAKNKMREKQLKQVELTQYIIRLYFYVLDDDDIHPILTFIVKLHSNLQTQLNFSWLEKELTLFSHGRRRKEEEGRSNPHLAFSRRNDPTCLIFGDCLVGVWRVYGNCLEGVWRVSGRCPLAVWRVS